MSKLLISIGTLFFLTACHERIGTEPKPSKPSSKIPVRAQTYTKDENTAMPILTEDMTLALKSPPQITTHVVGLDMGDIRIATTPKHTRVVFDSYTTVHKKAKYPGEYSFSYLPSEHTLILTFEGYRSFSALSTSTIRSFPPRHAISKLSVRPSQDGTKYRVRIDLNINARINVFDLEAPGRIVVDIIPN